MKKKPKFRFVQRLGDGMGIFQNTRTGEMGINPISESRLSVSALLHFGHREQKPDGSIVRKK